MGLNWAAALDNFSKGMGQIAQVKYSEFMRKDEAKRAHETYTAQLRPAHGGRRSKSSLGAGAAVAREASDRAASLATQTETEAEALRGTLRAWGMAALVGAWEAWQATDVEGRAAA